MENPRLIGERRFGDVREMFGEIETLLAMADLKWADVAYVKCHQDENSGYASILRLWQDRLTDGSWVYELHII